MEADVKESVRRQFGAAAARYAASAVHVGGPDLAAMLSAVPLTGRERVLDLGCGPGHTALAFSPQVQHVTGLDLTESMLAAARALAAGRGIVNATFELSDAEHLPHPDGSIDLITSRYSAHHYPRPDAALLEAARVLRSGGTLLLVDVVAPADPDGDALLNRIEILRDPSHVRDRTVDEWHAMASAAGLRCAGEVRLWPLQLDFASWIARMQTPTARVREIQSLFDAAPDPVRAAFAVEPDHSFTVPVALIVATRP